MLCTEGLRSTPVDLGGCVEAPPGEGKSGVCGAHAWIYASSGAIRYGNPQTQAVSGTPGPVQRALPELRDLGWHQAESWWVWHKPGLTERVGMTLVDRGKFKHILRDLIRRRALMALEDRRPWQLHGMLVCGTDRPKRSLPVTPPCSVKPGLLDSRPITPCGLCASRSAASCPCTYQKIYSWTLYATSWPPITPWLWRCCAPRLHAWTPSCSIRPPRHAA